MTPQQTVVAFAGLGLIAFRFFTSEQKWALSPLWGGTGNDPGNALGTNAHPGGLLLPGGLGGTGVPYPKVAPPPGQPLPHAPGLGPITNSQPNGLGGYYDGLIH